MEILFAVILAAILTGVILLVKEYLIPWVIIAIADHDASWSPYRIGSEPGKIIMMAKARERGSFALLYHDVPYWHYHQTDERFYSESDPKFREKFPDGPPEKNSYLEKYGVVPVGFFKRYYQRKRRWESWEQDPVKKVYTVVGKESKEGEHHLFYFSTTMAIRLTEVPTKEFYPVSLTLVFNVLLIAPRKAENLAGKWEVQANAAVLSRARDYITSKTVHELRNERDTKNQVDFSGAILRANEVQADEDPETVALLPAYGIMIQGPRYVEPDFESGDKEMSDATRRQLIAAEDVKTAVIRAEEATQLGIAEANRRKEAAVGILAEVAAWASVPGGAQIAMAEAIKVAKPQAVGGGVMGMVDMKE